MTNEYSSSEKYTSHFIRKGCKRVMCERWVGDWTDCSILTPSSSVFSSTSFSFCWAARPGAWGLVLTASNCNKLTPTNSTCLWHRVISLFDIHLLLVGVTSASNSTRPQSRLYPDIFDRMHLFLDWRLGRRSICNKRSSYFSRGYQLESEFNYKPGVRTR